MAKWDLQASATDKITKIQTLKLMSCIYFQLLNLYALPLFFGVRAFKILSEE